MVVSSAARRALAPVRAFSATPGASRPLLLRLLLPMAVLRSRRLQ